MDIVRATAMVLDGCFQSNRLGIDPKFYVRRIQAHKLGKILITYAITWQCLFVVYSSPNNSTGYWFLQKKFLIK